MGWGNVEDAVGGAEQDALTARVAAILPGADLTPHEPPSADSLGLPEPGVCLDEQLMRRVLRPRGSS